MIPIFRLFECRNGIKLEYKYTRHLASGGEDIKSRPFQRTHVCVYSNEKRKVIVKLTPGSEYTELETIYKIKDSFSYLIEDNVIVDAWVAYESKVKAKDEAYFPRHFNCIVMEYGGKTLCGGKYNFSRDERVEHMISLAEKLMMLSSAGFCYMDIKSNNITIDKGLTLRLIDYGGISPTGCRDSAATYPHYLTPSGVNLTAKESNVVYGLGALCLTYIFGYQEKPLRYNSNLGNQKSIQLEHAASKEMLEYIKQTLDEEEDLHTKALLNNTLLHQTTLQHTKYMLRGLRQGGPAAPLKPPGGFAPKPPT